MIVGGGKSRRRKQGDRMMRTVGRGTGTSTMNMVAHGQSVVNLGHCCFGVGTLDAAYAWTCQWSKGRMNGAWVPVQRRSGAPSKFDMHDRGMLAWSLLRSCSMFLLLVAYTVSGGNDTVKTWRRCCFAYKCCLCMSLCLRSAPFLSDPCCYQ
ncbi:hypothetical protein CYLTODRAFT_82874 [Cylindrobasidium torrendii FP15055 ss-10]|uniref:Uncharacterized protein n=1 Tax=Cylindrobasidium torrendii FP15055 ss-10 TaxID=1314674 RepID=A0A0D7B2Q0_9AGAR|nr:hypothetical protein CYLTODRAFT_82874 [Cylindrobasidium torrendii FP15055 ss-10]